MTSDTSVSTLPFVGPQYTKLLENLGIKTVGDLLYHLPSKYLDLSKITPIDQLEVDELQVIQAKVYEIKSTRIKGGRTLAMAIVGDSTGSISLTWFNQPYIAKSLQQGAEYRFAGEVEAKFGKRQMTNPTHELAAKPMIHTGRLVPIYPQTAGISSKWLRARIAPLLNKVETIVPEFLPAQTTKRNSLLSLSTAISQLHTPGTIAEAQQARHRLAFDELLLLQLAGLERKQQWQQGREAPLLTVESPKLTGWIKSLPFDLTEAQRRSLDEILADMSRSTPMNRLLEGDVGSGKTVVALLASLVAIENGFQAAIMAPTAVLAQQHFQTFDRLLSGSGLSSIATVSLRTSSSKMTPSSITIGTHALLQEKVEFSNLGLVIIDEQHRFGVEQRATLMNKARQAVHLLTMTATPIPRTLALTAYGDLDLSIIDTLPKGRLPIKTHIVPQQKRNDMYPFMAQTLDRGEQAYVVCPLIEESEAESLTSVKAATTEFERLEKLFEGYKLGLLHGRMKPAEKEAVLAEFKAGVIQLLVATPVVEVGIDVPNATILVIEAAERFGLAQLHQLRGRVGRGDKQSFCFLLSDATDALEQQRLRHMEQESSGLKLAELDLQTRGPGEVYGVRQSGLPELKAASFFDLELVEQTRHEAENLLPELFNLPSLREKIVESQPQIELN